MMLVTRMNMSNWVQVLKVLKPMWHVYLGCVVNHNFILIRAHLITKVILLVFLFGGLDLGLDLGLDCGAGLRESCTHNFV